MQVRAHIPQFVGKRSLDDEVVENILLKQQEENNDEENLENVCTRNIIQEMLRSTS
jgi:translation elongation factor EF-Ts